MIWNGNLVTKPRAAWSDDGSRPFFHHFSLFDLKYGWCTYWMAYFHLFGNVTISVQSRGWTHQAHAHGGAMGIRDKKYLLWLCLVQKMASLSDFDNNQLFDSIIDDVGSFGVFQKRTLGLSLVVSALAAFNHLSPIYYLFTPQNYTCSHGQVM